MLPQLQNYVPEKTRVSARDMNALIKAAQRASALSVAPPLQLVNTGAGIQIRIKREAAVAGTTVFPVKITAGGPGDTYTIDVFADGTDQAATATGETLKIPQILGTETVPVNTFLMAVEISGTFYGQVNVWL